MSLFISLVLALVIAGIILTLLPYFLVIAGVLIFEGYNYAKLLFTKLKKWVGGKNA